MRARLQLGAALLLASLSTACISGNYTRRMHNLPLLERAEAELPQSGVDLQRCLEVLGAPTLVYEYEIHGLLLVYAWNHRRQWNASFTVPTGEALSPSISLADIRDNEQGIVLKLDASWQLQEWKHGYLRALVGAEPRPATHEQLGSS